MVGPEWRPDGQKLKMRNSLEKCERIDAHRYADSKPDASACRLITDHARFNALHHRRFDPFAGWLLQLLELRELHLGERSATDWWGPSGGPTVGH